ncbi:hypothetical protein AVD99_002384 [Salmonella enterica subsp. enterica]|nr:hypothetical protein [Salmonella enterica]EBG5866658.1 hypothetical protein [Salmonella enterica subsp. enterica serovar Essen]ECI7809169.1 hypothetical protein [Salmonella enterica subsp. enterica]EDR5086037.1 hypothetical protein [Salmonella enterica subsp. enterica serovar Kingston]EDX8417728.1 hypothetical protein [Salmonella enterica subsp. enterica serovar Riverside]
MTIIGKIRREPNGGLRCMNLSILATDFYRSTFTINNYAQSLSHTRQDAKYFDNIRFILK